MTISFRQLSLLEWVRILKSIAENVNSTQDNIRLEIQSLETKRWYNLILGGFDGRHQKYNIEVQMFIVFYKPHYL